MQWNVRVFRIIIKWESFPLIFPLDPVMQGSAVG